jgi:putative ABC transport system ATP-binding protein
MVTAPSDSSSARSVLIQVRDVSKVYGSKAGREQVHALRGVNLDVYSGEYLSLMGPSGSGKSTLFNVIGALDRPSSGGVRLQSLDLGALSRRELAYVRCTYVGYVFQAYNLIASLSALDNVSLPRVLAGASRREAEQVATERLSQVGLAHRLRHRPGELSGGQQQRVAIARAIVNDPTLILADEPTANLDLQTGGEVIQLLKRLSVERGVTVVTATHDHEMLQSSDRVVHLRDGRIERIQLREELEIRQGVISVRGEHLS